MKQSMKTRSVILTGGIGSGKSLVASFFKGKGIPVYDSDSQAKSLYDRYPELKDGLTGIFGTDDLKTVARLAFADKDKLYRLEALVHPKVFEDYFLWKEQYDGSVPFVLFESAIILQKHFPARLADEVIFVKAPEHLRLERTMERDASDELAVRSRMARQDNDDSDPRITYFIDNDGSVEELKNKTENIYYSLTR